MAKVKPTDTDTAETTEPTVPVDPKFEAFSGAFQPTPEPYVPEADELSQDFDKVDVISKLYIVNPYTKVIFEAGEIVRGVPKSPWTRNQLNASIFTEVE